MTKFSYTDELDDFKNTAHWLARRGWSEGAGGNLSVRLDMPGSLHEDDHIPLPFSMPALAGKAFLLSGTGTRAREIGADPLPHIGLYKISDDGAHYGWIAGNKTPTTELPAHCAIHNALEIHRPADKAILHTHPVSIISLFHLDGFDSTRVISDKILSLQSEARLIIPEGAGYVPHELPGSLELGVKSAAQVEHHQIVLWQYHGALATGPTLGGAFDLLEVFEKSARIYWQLRTANINPKGIPQNAIEHTLKTFGRMERYLKVKD